MMMVALLLVLHLGLAAALTSGIGWLALASWRRATDAHWAERARLLWPARVSNNMLFFSIPAALTAVQLFELPDLPLSYAYAGLAGFVGAALGMWPLSHAIFPQMPFRRWLKEMVALAVIRLFTIGVLIVAGICMPWELGWSSLALAGGVLAMILWLIYGGTLQLLSITGTLTDAPPRLPAIVSEVAERMHLPLPKIGLLRGLGANAIAFPVVHTLVVTEGAMDALSDEELATVCAHEFAHLHEPKSVIAARILTALAALPAIFIKPALQQWDGFGCIALGVAMTLIARFSRNFRNRMEKRADSMATVHEGDSPGTYARALEKIYQVNQVPAVLSKSMVHPSLYDRLLAAGVTPSYPRPKPPAKFSWHRGFALVLLMASVAAVVNQVMSTPSTKPRSRPSKATRWREPSGNPL